MKCNAERVRKVFKEQYGVAAISPEFKRTDGRLDGDSLDDIEACMSIEEEFDIEISDADWEGCKTIGDVIDLIGRLKGED